MDDLARWLGQQLDVDEQNAKDRRGIFPSAGVDDDGTVWLHVRPGGNAVLVRQRDPIEGYDDLAKLKNWADTDDGWTQERVLREVDAKRAVLKAFAEVAENYGRDDVEYADGWVSALGFAVRNFAAAYSHRPGYREEWRPH